MNDHATIPARPHAGSHAGTCLNCDTALMGHYCHVCGQDARTAEPSLREFGLDLLEMMTHADSKVVRTIRRLFFEPARLTRDYIAGRRASEIPPIRMFFVSLLLFFSLASVAPFHQFINEATVAASSSTTAPGAAPGVTPGATPGNAPAEAPDARLKAAVGALSFSGPKVVRSWLHEHLVAAVDNPDEVQHVMGEWAERMVLLLLPISALVLWVLYAFPKPVPLYDHLIVSLHSLTVLFLAVTVATVLDRFLPGSVAQWTSRVLILAMTVHLFRHLKGFYNGSTAGTIVRMGLLALATGAASVLLTFCLALIGLQFGATGE